MNKFFRSRNPEDFSQATLPLLLTALLVVMRPVDVWYLTSTTIALGIVALLFRSALFTPAIWAGIFVLSAARLVAAWPVADNHHYLFAYWTLAVFLAVWAPRPDRFLARSARWLVAAVFLWATLWKAVLSPDFMDGRFYTVRLLTDERFEATVRLVTDLSQDQIVSARSYLTETPGPSSSSTPEIALKSEALSRLAMFLTWATVLLEAAVGLVFLLPWGRWTGRLRHGLLLAFLVAAYPIAPVVGFGWMLAAMGVAQVPVEQKAWRAGYVAMFILLRFYVDVPWQNLLLRVRSLI
ncbi:MAG TPA: hypothetical protein VFH11_01050 [Gemmatimonadota bacterium]|nr:hypothetical protein [Gemmatimonadota bacterium]